MVVMMVMLVRVLMMLLLQVIELVLRRGTRGRSGRGQVVRFYHYDRRRRSIIVLSGEVVLEVVMCRVKVRMVRMLQVRMMVVQAVVLLLGRVIMASFTSSSSSSCCRSCSPFAATLSVFTVARRLGGRRAAGVGVVVGAVGTTSRARGTTPAAGGRSRSRRTGRGWGRWRWLLVVVVLTVPVVRRRSRPVRLVALDRGRIVLLVLWLAHLAQALDFQLFRRPQ